MTGLKPGDRPVAARIARLDMIRDRRGDKRGGGSESGNDGNCEHGLVLVMQT